MPWVTILSGNDEGMTETKVSKKPEVQKAHLICRKNRNVILSYWFSKMEAVSVLKNTKKT